MSIKAVKAQSTKVTGEKMDGIYLSNNSISELLKRLKAVKTVRLCDCPTHQASQLVLQGKAHVVRKTDEHGAIKYFLELIRC